MPDDVEWKAPGEIAHRIAVDPRGPVFRGARDEIFAPKAILQPMARGRPLVRRGGHHRVRRCGGSVLAGGQRDGLVCTDVAVHAIRRSSAEANDDRDPGDKGIACSSRAENAMLKTSFVSGIDYLNG